METLRLEPTIAIRGHLSIQDRAGNIRDAAGLTVYTICLNRESGRRLALRKLMLKATTRSICLSDGQFVSLYVQRNTDIHKQSWNVELVESTGADKTILE